jgi:ABC-type uncharacterized transport system permease subunit
MEKLEVFLFWFALVFTGITFLFYIRLFFLKSTESIYHKLASIFSVLTLISIGAVVALQWARTGLHPFTGPFSAKVFYAFSILLVFLIFQLLYSKSISRIRSVGVLIFPTVLLLLLLAWSQFEASSSIPPALSSFRVFVHITSAILAYGSYTVGTIFAIIYLVQEKQLKEKKGLQSTIQKLPSLETAELATHRALGIGLIFTVILLLTGMFTAQMVWGRMWDWREPREVSALLMFIVYSLYFVVRDVLSMRGRRSSYIALIGFVVAIFTYFTPALFTSLHAWGRGF